jgi:hypothetical protein
MLARDKHSSLLRALVNCGRKKFYSVGLRSGGGHDGGEQQRFGVDPARPATERAGAAAVVVPLLRRVGGPTRSPACRRSSSGANVIKLFADVIYEFS